MDAVDPGLVSQIFAWIRPGRRTVPLPEASLMLVDAQARAIRAFREAGLFVTTRFTVYPGINEAHVEDVANAVAALGADMLDVLACRACAPAPAPLAPTGCTPAECASCGSSKTCASAPANSSLSL